MFIVSEKVKSHNKDSKNGVRTRRMDQALESLRERWKSFLSAKYDEWWQAQPSGRENRNIDRFADYLGIEASNMRNYYYKGTLPRDENLTKLARRLGPEVRQFSGNILPEGLLDVSFFDLPAEQRETLDLFTGLMVHAATGDAATYLSDDERARIVQSIVQIVALLPPEQQSQVDKLIGERTRENAQRQ